MKPKAMKHLGGETTCHACAPKAWRDIPNISGDYDFDATVAHRDNPSLPDKMAMYLRKGKSFGPVTAYNGYGGYGGDS